MPCAPSQDLCPASRDFSPPLHEGNKKQVDLLGELEGEGKLMPSCLQDGGFTIVCGQNRLKTIISLLQNFLPGQRGGGDVQDTARWHKNSSARVQVQEQRHDSGARPTGDGHCLLCTLVSGTHNPGAPSWTALGGFCFILHPPGPVAWE